MTTIVVPIRAGWFSQTSQVLRRWLIAAIRQVWGPAMSLIQPVIWIVLASDLFFRGVVIYARFIHGLLLAHGFLVLIVEHGTHDLGDRLPRDPPQKVFARKLLARDERSTGESDERGIRQGIAHVPGEAVDEVVLAAVRLVGDDDDIPSLR